MHHRMLVAGDDPQVTGALKEHMIARGYDVVELLDFDAPLPVPQTELDAVIINVAADASAALKLAQSMMSRANAAHSPLLMITSHRTSEAVSLAIAAGAFDCIAPTRRPSPAPQRDHFGALWGSSEAMQKLFSTMARVAGTDSTVLITGESGTGKELVAQGLHQHSTRAGARFSAINCGAVTPTLFESELFGHVRGAFTDARSPRKGIFREADGGTVFLDEIAEIPIEVQARLLRVLQERRVRPVGSDAEVPFNVRIIAATRSDLRKEVEAKRFREDLFFRLNVVELQVPPLRERKSDIRSLATKFAQAAAARAKKSHTGLSPELIASLENRTWPGNVRELLNAIERAVVLSKNPVLSLGDVEAHAGVVAEKPKPAKVTAESLEEVERRHVMSVIDAVGGNQSRAARVLGIDRVTLYRKLKAWGDPRNAGGQPF